MDSGHELPDPQVLHAAEAASTCVCGDDEPSSTCSYSNADESFSAGFKSPGAARKVFSESQKFDGSSERNACDEAPLSSLRIRSLNPRQHQPAFLRLYSIISASFLGDMGVPKRADAMFLLGTLILLLLRCGEKFACDFAFK